MQKTEESFNVAQNVRLKPLVQFALIAGPFLSMIDSSVVNIALPVIATNFHTSLIDTQWVLSGYLLALGALLPASAFLSKRFGAGRVYFYSVVGFTVASFLCAVSFSLSSLIATRVLQGALGAALVPVAMDLLLGNNRTPSGTRESEGAGSRDGSPVAGQLSPMLGIILFLAPALGPTLGGFLVGYAGWPSIFLINVPIGIVSAFLVRRYSQKIPQRKPETQLRFDIVGSILLSLGLLLAIYGASEGPQVGWLSVQAFPFLVTGSSLLAIYALWAVRRQNPAVNLKLLRHGETALALGISALASIVLFAVLFLLPVFMESFQGLSSLDAGLVLLPQGLVTGIGTIVGDKVSRRRGLRFATVLGMGILTATTAGLLLVDVPTPAWIITLILSGRGLALGLVIQPLLLATIGSLAGSEVSDGNTLFNVLERLAGTVGIALLATFFQLREQFYVSNLLSKFGINLDRQNNANSALSSLPRSVLSQLSAAATSSFHDTVLLLVILSFSGLMVSVLLRKNPRITSVVGH